MPITYRQIFLNLWLEGTDFFLKLFYKKLLSFCEYTMMYFLNTFSRSELFSNPEKNIFSSSFQKSHRHIKINKGKAAKKHIF